MRSVGRHWLGAMAAAFVPLAARAADAAGSGAEKLRGFGLAESDAGALPVGRVIFTFVLVAALAWAAVWLLRRYGFRGGLATPAGPAPIRPIARNTLPGGVTCHVVETHGRRVLLTVTRHGVSSVVLGDSAPPP